MTKVRVQILMKRVSRHKGMWREIPEDDLDGEDDDDSEEEQDTEGWGTLHLTMNFDYAPL